MKKWLIMIGLSLITIAIISIIIKKIPNNTNTSKSKGTYEVPPVSANAYEYITVNYSSRMGNVINLPSEKMVAFIGASQPYCVFNANDQKFCGSKNEDISDQMGDTKANRKLRFVSSNGSNGTIKLRLRDKTQAEL